MPKFEVRVVSYFQFDAKDALEARNLVEFGEMPRDREISDVYIDRVKEIKDY